MPSNQRKTKTSRLGLATIAFFVAAGMILYFAFSPHNAPATALSNPDKLTVVHELGETVVSKNPETVIVFDFGSLDTLHYLGVEVTGVPKTNIPSYLSEFNDAKYVNVGSLQEPDFERIFSLRPDLIIISGRQAAAYDELSRIAPTIHLGVDFTRYMESFEENARTIGRIFEKEDEVEARLAVINANIDSVRDRVESIGVNALITLAADTSMSAFGERSRFGLIHDVLGFKTVDASIVSSTHGQTISFEYILTRDPDFLFVVDRSRAIGSERDTSVQDMVENQLVKLTKAYRNGNIVYLDPEPWYLSGGGLISVGMMIDEVSESLR